MFNIEIKFKKKLYRYHVTFYLYTGCPKKNAWSCFLTITPLWKGVGRKVGGVLKTSGNSLCDRHKNFPNWPFRSWENWVQRWQLSLKNLEKNWENLLNPLLSIYLFWTLKFVTAKYLFKTSSDCRHKTTDV